MNSTLKTLYSPDIRGRGPLVFNDNGHQRIPRVGSKEYNQLLKCARRAQRGKPSYRQRQASARAAKSVLA